MSDYNVVTGPVVSVQRPVLRPIKQNMIDAAYLLYKHWAPILLAQVIMFVGTMVTVMISVLVVILGVVGLGVSNISGDELALKVISSPLLWIGFGFMFFAMFVFMAFGYAAMITALGHQGEGMAPIDGSMKKGLGFLVPMLGLFVFWTLGVTGGYLLLIFPAIILSVGLCFAAYILVLEKVSVFEAFGTSWQITKGYKWPVFGRMLLLGLAVFGVMMVLMIGSLVPILGLVANLAQFALNFVITPYMMAYMYYMYQDLRVVRKEVYPLKGGIAVFMAICCVLSVGLFAGMGYFVYYMVEKYAL